MIVKMMGGLGNQMFQYAYAKALEKRGHEVKIDISYVEARKLHGGYQLDKYNVDLTTSTKEEVKQYHLKSLIFKILRKIGVSKIIVEKSLLFDAVYLNVKYDSYVIGYFQSEKYFKDIRGVLIKQFVIKENISNYTRTAEIKILEAKNSCSIHIRRGDYISKNNINIHGFCGLEYYKNAIKYLQDKVVDLNFFIFSDDIEWVKDNLKIENTTYIDSNKRRDPHEDIYLMGLCDHHIIANSSFSWWGAWLSQNENGITVAPKRWFKDSEREKQSHNIVSSDWIRV